MRRIYADKLICATRVIVMLMSVLFALCRANRGGIGRLAKVPAFVFCTST